MLNNPSNFAKNFINFANLVTLTTFECNEFILLLSAVFTQSVLRRRLGH